MNAHLRFLPALLLCLLPTVTPAADTPRRLALLVACSEYDPPIRELEGTPNDVLRMRELLRTQFRFAAEDIVVLSEAEGEKKESQLPRRANIEREFVELSKKAGKGVEVVVYLCGHGARVPEPDELPAGVECKGGWRSAFLPADVKPREFKDGVLKNAILDYEFRRWTDAILARGAFVWVVVDACHSATLMRDPDQERVREVPPEVLCPPEVIRKANQRDKQAGKARGGSDSAFGLDGRENLVALYACQLEETTPELLFAVDAQGKKVRHGLLTFSLCQELSQPGGKISYRDLAERIRARYTRMERDGPTPLVEGKEQDHVVLGRETVAPVFFHLKSAGARWTIDGGKLHGLTEGSVLAVLGKDGNATGHVRITEALAVGSQVEACPFAGLAKPDRLEAGSPCKPVFIDYGVLKPRVAAVALRPTAVAETPETRTQAEKDIRRLAEQLRDAAGNPSFFEVVDDPASARWLLCEVNDKPQLLSADGLVALTKDPPAGTKVARGAAGKDHLLLPGVGPRFTGSGEELRPWLAETLARIAHVQNLLRVSDPSASRLMGEAGVAAELQIVRLKNEHDTRGTPVPWDRGGISLHEDDWITFKIVNRGKEPIFATLLLVDDEYRVRPLYPALGDSQARIAGGSAIRTPPRKLKAAARLEHLLLIAVRAGERSAVDFSCLAEPTFAKARSVDEKKALGSPLGQLLQGVVYHEGTTRGADRAVIDQHAMLLRSFRTAPRPPEK